MTVSEPISIHPADVIGFWRSAGPSRWFRKDAAFDTEFRERFLAAHKRAARGDFDGWAREAEGALALLVLLDQFPRNAFRGNARMFATDERARTVARAAIESGLDIEVDPPMRQFFYLPLMHSEAIADQDLCLELTLPLGEEAARYSRVHRDIIARFGRFPHRNALIGRTTTPEEQRFLSEGGFAG